MFRRKLNKISSYKGCVLHVSANCYGDSSGRGSEAQVWEMLGSTDRKYVLFARHVKNTLEIRRDGIMTFVLLPKLFTGQWIFFFYNPVVFLACLALRPHVVLAQCPVLGGLGGVFYRMFNSTRLVVELHGQHFFSALSSTFWHRFGHFVFFTLAGFVMAKADAVRALSKNMAKQINQKYHVQNSKIVVVPPRFNPASFVVQKKDFRIDKLPRFISVGGLTNVKNYVGLIYSLEQAEIKCELRLVGTGPLHADLIATSAKTKFVNIKLCGRLSAEDVANELVNSDVYIQFSLSEGMPRAIMEAMYVGTPVLSRDVGSVGELMKPMRSNCVFQSEEQFIAQLRALLGSEEYRRAISLIGKNRISTKYDPKILISEYKKLVFRQ